MNSIRSAREPESQSPDEQMLGAPNASAFTLIALLMVLAMITVLFAGEMRASEPLNTPTILIAGRGLYHAGTSTNAPVVYNFTWIEKEPSVWFITLVPGSGKGDSFAIEYGGKEVRTLVQRVNGDGMPSYYANLLPGPEPIQFTQPLVATIWLAYSRAAKEQFADSGVATCPFSETGEVRKLRHESKQDGKVTGFRDLAFFDDGVDAVSQKRRRPPFDKGFKQFIFEASKVVVTNGVEVFLASRMIEFLPKSDANTADDLVVRRSCELIAEEITFPALPSMSANLPNQQAVPVADARLGNFRKAIFYTFTNEWPTMAQLQTTPEYLEWRVNNRDLVYSSRSKVVRVAFIVGLAVLSGFAILLSRKRLFSKQ